jgi:WD40 repeat protein
MGCTRRCGGALVPVAPPALTHLDGCDLGRLPYPVALTATRLAAALRASGDVLKTLFLLKDCFEATIKYAGAVMLADFRSSPACTPEHNSGLLEKMIRPSLGVWVETVVGSLSRWLLAGPPPGGRVAGLFMTAGKKPRETELFAHCRAFVDYRNGALGHGAMRSDAVYAADLQTWLPRLRQLLDGLAGVAGWRLCLPTERDRYRVWMGPRPGDGTEPGDSTRELIGRFALRGPAGEVRDLYPFVCYLPDPQKECRLHYYDSLSRYTAVRKEVEALEYDHGFKQSTAAPVAGLEEAFTAELLAKAFGRHRERMAVVEGRVADFGELIEAHAAIVGRRFVIDHVRDFLSRHERGLLVIEAQPGKGKTALVAHLIEEVFPHYAPRPVHFFYRRTAGITDPDVCVRSLYHALLEVHGITEAEESKQENSPEGVYNKLTKLLSREIAPRLLSGRPQLVFIDALDEAGGGAFQRIPENLPAGVYVIATTRPVSDRTALARREHLHWYDLDAPDLLQDNLRDGAEYVRREMLGAELPDETVGEIARTGAGNFLVLRLLCQHLRTTLPPEQVGGFLRRLAADGGRDQLGFIYAEFWQRLTDRSTRADLNLLCDVAGVLVTAYAPLTADVVCGVLGLRAGDWDYALRQLAEYLTVVEDGAGCPATFYRVYHESFADFLRAKVAVSRNHLCNHFADYCLKWSRLPDGYGRSYALRFGSRHLLEAGRWLEATFFLEAKAQTSQVLELPDDFAAAVARLPHDAPGRHLLSLLHEATANHIRWLSRHPTTLFQCLWNSCWWYDCPAAAKHSSKGGGPPGGRPWESDGEKLYRFLEEWRAEKERVTPGFQWLRELRPDTPDWSCEPNCMAFSPDGKWIAVGESFTDVTEIWEVATGEQTDFLFGHDGEVTSLAWSPDSRFLASGSLDRSVKLWSLGERGFVLAGDRGCEGPVRSLAFAPDGRRLAVGMSDGRVTVWSLPEQQIIAHWEAGCGKVLCLAFSPDGLSLSGGSDGATVHIWDAVSGKELHRFTDHDDLWHDPDPNFPGDWVGVSPLTEAAEANRSLRAVVQVAFSLDGNRLASAGRDGKVIVRPVVGGPVLEEYLLPHTDIVVAANPSGFPWQPALDYPYHDYTWEVIVRLTRSGEIVAWLPEEVEHLRVHPGGRVFAGLGGNRLLLFLLEGDGLP